jgi:hypothetical protein
MSVVASGFAIPRGQNGPWASFRDRVAPWITGVIALGLIVMWWANLTSLLGVGGFVGIEGWLLPGIVLVAINCWLLLKRIIKEWSQPGRGLLLWQFLPMFGNFVVNGFAIYLIEFNIRVGILRRGTWDKWCLGIAAGTVVLMTIIRWLVNRKTYRNDQYDEATKRFHKTRMAKWFIAVVTVGTRAIQQAMLVLSPQLAVIPWGTPVGLTAIAMFYFFLSWVEHRAARERGTAGEREAQLIKWANGSNFFAALVLLAGWIAKHNGLL